MTVEELRWKLREFDDDKEIEVRSANGSWQKANLLEWIEGPPGSEWDGTIRITDEATALAEKAKAIRETDTNQSKQSET